MDIEKNSTDLIDKYGDMIYHIALGYFRNKHDSEDIVQEVFAQYLNRIRANKTFNNKDHEKFWVITVTKNLCINELNCSERKNISLEDIEVKKLMLFNDKENHILDRFDKLKDKYRVVMELFYLRDLKISQISKILHITEANVKVRLTRAREDYKKFLKLGGE